MQRYAGRADRVSLRLETAGRIDRQATALLGDPFADDTVSLTRSRQTHGLVLDEFGNGEAVMGLNEIEIVHGDAGTCARLFPSNASTGKGGRVTPRERQDVVDVLARAERD